MLTGCPLKKRGDMKKGKVENKAEKQPEVKADPANCQHKYFNMIEGTLYCSECGLPADEVKKNKVETK